MKKKKSPYRIKEVKKLREILLADEEVMQQQLPWARDRLRILYHMEGIDPTALDKDEAEKKAADKAAAEAAEKRAQEEAREMERMKKRMKRQRNNHLNSITRRNAAGERLISPQELAYHDIEERGLWLSILGKVYDVSEGNGTKFYGAEGPYHFYAGRDASPCFSHGINERRGLMDRLEEWDGERLMPVLHWAEFYEDHEVYEFLGLLAGTKYFDEDGSEGYTRKNIIRKAEEAKAISDEKKEKERQEKFKNRRKKKEEREMMKEKKDEL